MKNFMDVLKDALVFGHTVSFKKEGNQLSVRVQKKVQDQKNGGVMIIKTHDQLLPIETHTTEGSIADCIQWQCEKLR